MYTIRYDLEKNRLYCILRGSFTVEEMRTCVDATIEASRQLKPGFGAVTDISEMTPPSPGVEAEIERAQAHFVAAGIGHGVRVVRTTNVISAIAFLRAGSRVDYRAEFVSTLAEAEQLLDTLEEKTT